LKKPPSFINSNTTTNMIGDYLIQKQLGQGSFGVVQLARHQVTSQRVAIKVASRDEIFKEYNMLSSLDHPNILRVSKVLFEVPASMRGKPHHEHAMVMDFMEGGDLVDLLATHNGRIPQKMAMKFLVQLLSAVNYLHQRGISHRDIKPDNLLFDASVSNLVLADFGLAEFCDPNNALCGSTGSLVYCAPEILRGKSYRGAEADIWSVGVVFYCMLTGCIPWEGENINQQLNHALKGRYCKSIFVSGECEALVASMLAVDPKQRPTASQLLQHLAKSPLMRRPTARLKIAMHRGRTD